MKSLLAICTLSLAIVGCTTSQQSTEGIAKTCETGKTFYGYIITADSTGQLPVNLKSKADQSYAILIGICEKETVTEADIVLAAAQVYILTKSWKDAN